MRELFSKILGSLHIIIIAYTIYGVYEKHEEYTATLLSIQSQTPGVQNEIKVFKRKLEAIETYKKNIENSKKSVEEVFKNIERVQRQLPAEVNDIDILDFIAKESKLLNIPEMVSTPMPEVPEGFYITKPYKIVAKGTFLQLVVFLERLSRAERIFNIQNFTLASDETPQKGRFQIIGLSGLIETYKYNQNFKETSGVEEINAQFNGNPGGATREVPRRRRRKINKGAGDE